VPSTTLLCAEGNLAFDFEGGRDITVRGLTLDTIKLTFTQGGVVAVDASGTLDVQVMDGYPEPPDEAFLTASGGGGDLQKSALAIVDSLCPA
jgi:hypothetical protein